MTITRIGRLMRAVALLIVATVATLCAVSAIVLAYDTARTDPGRPPAIEAPYGWPAGYACVDELAHDCSPDEATITTPCYCEPIGG